MANTDLAPKQPSSFLIEGSGWPEGDEIVEEVLARCHQSDALKVIGEMIERVRTMKMPDRFRTDRTPNWDNALKIPNPLAADFSEAEFKRFQLLADLQRVQQEMSTVFSGLCSVVLDIEVSSREM